MVWVLRISTSSAQVDGQSCGQADAPIRCGAMRANPTSRNASFMLWLPFNRHGLALSVNVAAWDGLSASETPGWPRRGNGPDGFRNSSIHPTHAMRAYLTGRASFPPCDLSAPNIIP